MKRVCRKTERTKWLQRYVEESFLKDFGENVENVEILKMLEI